jgi:chromosome segregation ATPase
MKQQLEQRLKELRSEFESGQKALADLEVKQMNLRNTLLRISGAIQVLEEELAKASMSEPEITGQLEAIGEEKSKVNLI